MEYLTTNQVSKLLGVSVRRVVAKIKQGRYPNAKRCECEQESWLIPESDLNLKKDEENVSER